MENDANASGQQQQTTSDASGQQNQADGQQQGQQGQQTGGQQQTKGQQGQPGQQQQDGSQTQDQGTVLGQEDAQGAPEKYTDFSVPEGMQLDSGLVERFSPIFKEANLSQAQAQKLVDAYSEHAAAESKGLEDAFTQTKTEWLDQAKADKEVGGQDFQQKVGKAVAAMQRFGTQELRKLLDDTGLGNHPEVIRFMYRVGKTIGEDQPGGGDQQPRNTGEVHDRWYPNESGAD